jgi:hypothetical protein
MLQGKQNSVSSTRLSGVFVNYKKIEAKYIAADELRG